MQLLVSNPIHGDLHVARAIDAVGMTTTSHTGPAAISPQAVREGTVEGSPAEALVT